MVIPSQQPPQAPSGSWVRRYGLLVALALLLPIVTAAAFLIVLLVPPAGRHFATQAFSAVFAVLLAVVFVCFQNPLPQVSKTAGVPAPTIRERFGRTWAYHLRIIVPLMFIWATPIMVFLRGMPRMQQYALAIAGMFAIQVVGYLLVRKRLCCPRCGSDFRKERHAQLGRWSMDRRMPWVLWDACPNCGVSFNGPWP